MIKGTSKNVVCDGCSSIINPKDYYHTVQGKKRVLHYHVLCTPFEHLNKINQNGKGNINTQADKKA